MNDGDPPRCVAMILCDSVVIDQFTQKMSLFGLFNGVTTVATPTGLNMGVLTSICEGRGVWELTLRIRDPQHRVLLNCNSVQNLTDPSSVYDIVMRIGNLFLTGPGEYDVDLIAGGKPIGHRSFRVEPLPTQQKVES